MKFDTNMDFEKLEYDLQIIDKLIIQKQNLKKKRATIQL